MHSAAENLDPSSLDDFAEIRNEIRAKRRALRTSISSTPELDAHRALQPGAAGQPITLAGAEELLKNAAARDIQAAIIRTAMLRDVGRRAANLEVAKESGEVVDVEAKPIQEFPGNLSS